MTATESSAPESNSKLVLSGIASIGFLLLFALILWLTYIPTHSTDINPDIVAKRESKLVETKSASEEVLGNYAVVNATEGVYRVPIEVAMELTVKSYQQ